MRRLSVLLVLLLLLAGCGTDPVPTESGGASAAPTDGTAEAPEDPAELISGGAVRALSLPGGVYTGLLRLGENVLLFSPSVGTRLTLISTADGTVLAEAELPGELSPESGTVQTDGENLGYYDAAEREIVLLDSRLEEFSRVRMPQDAEGAPVLSPALDACFYCQGETIRAMDIGTGVPRLLKEQPAKSLALRQCLFDGRVLTCVVTENDGKSYLSFLSTENGETLGTDESVWALASCGDLFFLRRSDGIVEEQVFGTLDGTLQNLLLAADANTVPALEAGGVMTVAMTDGGLRLDYYRLSDGKHAAALTVTGISGPGAYCADQAHIWFVAQEAETGAQKLYCWEPEKSPVVDSAVYTRQRYFATAPDSEGLAECRAVIAGMEERYGVTVLLGQDAVERPSGYILEPEYRAEAFQLSLDALEASLSRYPEGFFRTLCQGDGSGMLRICLVRDISNEMLGVQYWSEGQPYIALKVGTGAGQTFHHELSHVLDAYIIANSKAYDEWESLNPKGFTYDLSYELYRTREDTAYLEGKDRAFVDSYSMTYPKEDRAQIFEYAMSDGGQSVFESGAMQKKLRQICTAIRDAFGWKEDTRTFPWEQYLETPLAPES